MATKGERRALLFLAAVALLGAGTRVIRSRHGAVDSSSLDRQLDAVEATRSPSRTRSPPTRKTRERTSSDSQPPSSATPPATPVPVGPLDLDVATSDDIERLPGIGPAIAKRIVADREKNGGFGCLKALDGVKGIGPAMIARLDRLVAFSGARRRECTSGGDLRPGPTPIPAPAPAR